MELSLVTDIVKLFALSIVVLLLFGRLRIPSIVGFLITGIVAGPHGLGLIKAVHEVELLAEIGIIFLLFTIGIHFSIKELLRVKKSVLLGGSLQVALTTLAMVGVSQALGWDLARSLFLGWLLALSSTAIVLKLLEERAEMATPQGRNAVAILIFQDIIIFPMILFTPLLAGAAGNVSETLLLLAVKVIGLVAVVIVSARYLVPGFLYQIVRTRSRELFLLSVVVICFAVAWLTSSVGLSLSLGAFLAGLIISESEYSHEAMGNVMPFRDVFLSLFFVSIGMLLDVRVLFAQPLLILSITIGVILLKTLLATLAVFILGFPLRTCLIAGLTLSQVGEFSFILSRTGLSYELLTTETYQIFLAVSLVTMAATPFIMRLAPGVGDWIAELPLPEGLKLGLYPLNTEHVKTEREQLKDHLIIIGYGLNGRNLARAARGSGIPYIIIEMNPDTVRAERAKSEPIFYGDATKQTTLEHAHISTCRVVVIAISDAAATRNITTVCKRYYPHVHVIARTRFLQEMEPLHDLGADEVIPEEFETSVQIFTRVLRHYLIPNQEIEKFVAELRLHDYETLRRVSKPVTFTTLKQTIPELEISTFRLTKKSPFAGKSLAEIDLQNRYEVTALLIQRDGEAHIQPKGRTKLQANDAVTIIGKPDKIAELDAVLRASD